jgi:hypothetical protein
MTMRTTVFTPPAYPAPRYVLPRVVPSSPPAISSAF